MEKKNNKNTETVNYILTFVAVLFLIGSFATHLITGTKPLIAMDSLAGSLLLGIVFVLYLIWFIYDTAANHDIGFTASAKINLKSNPAAYCIYAFWFVFIIIPIILK